jgi:hypothetical protein
MLWPHFVPKDVGIAFGNFVMLHCVVLLRVISRSYCTGYESEVWE